MKEPSVQRNGNFLLVPYRPRRRVLMLGLLFCVVGAVGGLGYWYGMSRAVLDDDYVRALVRRDRANESQIAALRSQLVDAELARAVDQQATESLRETIATLRQEIAELRDEAGLYRNMLDPGNAGQGLRIADFELSATRDAGRYRYHVLLTRVDPVGEVARGRVAIDVSGISAGGRQSRPVALALDELAELEEYPIPFRFRYFQGVSGVLELPSDFEPEAVRVRLLASEGRSEVLRKEFAWSLDQR